MTKKDVCTHLRVFLSLHACVVCSAAAPSPMKGRRFTQEIYSTCAPSSSSFIRGQMKQCARFFNKSNQCKPSGKLCVCHAALLLQGGASENMALICSCSNIQANKKAALAAKFPSRADTRVPELKVPLLRLPPAPLMPGQPRVPPLHRSPLEWRGIPSPQHVFKQLLIIPRRPQDREQEESWKEGSKERSWPGICRPRGENM